jgi:hypothetical protein
MPVTLRFYQLRGYPHGVSCSSHTAFEYVLNTQLRRNRANIEILIPESERG